MQTKNPMLAQIEQQTEAKVPADLKPTFERIVAQFEPAWDFWFACFKSCGK